MQCLYRYIRPRLHEVLFLYFFACSSAPLFATCSTVSSRVLCNNRFQSDTSSLLVNCGNQLMTSCSAVDSFAPYLHRQVQLVNSSVNHSCRVKFRPFLLALRTGLFFLPQTSAHAARLRDALATRQEQQTTPIRHKVHDWLVIGRLFVLAVAECTDCLLWKLGPAGDEQVLDVH